LSRQLKILKRTVVLTSPPLTKNKISILSYIYQIYGRILVEALEFMLRENTSSWIKAKKLLYNTFRAKYPDIPSHYIHEAIRDASQRIKSFRKLKKKGLAETEKPVVRKWSVGCDNQLWKLTLSGVRIATHKGWIAIPLHFHKLFWRYYNSGWRMGSNARWKLVGNKFHLYVVFEKDVECSNTTSLSKVYGIDINENNVTIHSYPVNKAITIVTNFSKVVLGYAYRRARIQQRWSKEYGVNGNRRLKVALRKLREKNVKVDIKRKLVKMIVDTVKDGVVVLEKLPKRFQDKVLEKNGRLNGLDAHRIKQSSMRGLHKLIIEKLLEQGISHVLVNPSHTSTTCPVCGFKLTPMTGCAQRNGWKPRIMKCTNCGFMHDRDVIGAINLVKKHLIDVSPVPLGSKGAHDHRVEWLVVTMKRGAEAQPALAKPIMT